MADLGVTSALSKRRSPADHLRGLRALVSENIFLFEICVLPSFLKTRTNNIPPPHPSAVPEVRLFVKQTWQYPALRLQMGHAEDTVVRAGGNVPD